MALGLIRTRQQARACGPCRRAQRRDRPDHRCYGAVTGSDVLGELTWISCPCGCLVVADSLDHADPDDDTVRRVLAGGAKTDPHVAPPGDEDVDRRRRHFSTG